MPNSEQSEESASHALGEVPDLRYAQDDITIYILRLQCITKSV